MPLGYIPKRQQRDEGPAPVVSALRHVHAFAVGEAPEGVSTAV